MANIEVDSFVTKFRQLWSAGYNATLTLDAVDGKVSVCLKSELGGFDLALTVVTVSYDR